MKFLFLGLHTTHGSLSNYWSQKRSSHYHHNNVQGINKNVSNIYTYAKEDKQSTVNNNPWFVELSQVYFKMTQQVSSRQMFQKASLANYLQLQK